MKARNIILSAALAAVLLVPAAVAQSSAALVSPAPLTPNQFVYLPQLPTVAELNHAAAAQGIAIDRIDQANGQLVAEFRLPDGRTNVVAYALIAAGDPSAVPMPASPPPAPGTTVVYQPTPAPSTVYVYDSGYDAYAPWLFPLGLAVGLGFGHGWGWYHGGYYHGYHHY
jgi:hypothetical protein